MTPPVSPLAAEGRRARFGPPLPPTSIAGFGVAVIAVLLIAFFSYRALQTREVTGLRVTRTLQVIDQLQQLMSGLKDAETGQRGFLLTGAERYLEPYENAKAALPGEFKRMREIAADSPEQRQRLDTLQQVVDTKMQELAETIALRRSGNAAGALEIVLTDRGRAAMDNARDLIGQMTQDEQRMLALRQVDWQEAITLSSRVQGVGSLTLMILIALGAVVASRDYRARETQIWLRAGQAGMSLTVQSEQRLDRLGEAVLRFLAEYLDAKVGALYLANDEGGYDRVASYAVPPEVATVRPGDGLLGQVVKEGRPMRVSDVPAGYLPVSSSLGGAAPRELLLSPAVADGVVHGVFELGFFRTLQPADLELLARLSEVLGVAVRSAKDRTRLEELLEETQRQSEELQAQQEELRVSNEELEEQTQALQESQAQLESQQTELEQTNSQLEEQAQLLETQRDDLAQSQAVLNAKALELERSNQYKSEFLANMSHELRTPLNSTLILAKLLADNKHGNLTPEQVKFAKTISSAGNDLLTLINDILDLSKIEAGKFDLNVEPVRLAAAVDALIKGLQPVALQKSLLLRADTLPDAPAQIETDPQRLGQILKNLVANALKFTERGEVTLVVAAGPGETVSFTVRDTGIGIPADQQALIFEAFQQGDGSTRRKYGGTGLGLSISRDLAHLLGGEITVRSAPGQGSEFTLTLPNRYVAVAPVQTALAVPAAASPETTPAPPRAVSTGAANAKDPVASAAAPVPRRELLDDRDALNPQSRRILVIEDDVRFAAILRDLTHEMGFQCIVTHAAGDGLAAALAYQPSGILLDMNLPDHSGLGVLDQLKHDARTRHIPVHVLSASDYIHQAMERGAVGYDLKPVKREQLVSAIERLEAKSSQHLRRVLVVEDDERQRESMHQLLAADDVEIVGVASALEALEQLRLQTFDCLIMDLNLPDLSGYQLLERLSEENDASFPPVIVYTGRSLTGDEEQQLRRYSKSIIIKDARSPERLLDEVTLFLHQVESSLPAQMQQMLKMARDRDGMLDGRRVLVVEDDVRNVFALTAVLEPKGAKLELARNGREALDALARSQLAGGERIDLVLMDIMMPEMDGYTAMREIRKQPQWKKLPIIALTAKAMKDDQEKCLSAGANDYIAKPLDVEKLLSLIRVWMPK